MFRLTKKRAVAMAVVGSLALSAGAYAYFTAGGSGTGSASVGTSTAWAITSSAPSGGPLMPDGITEQTLNYTVTNPATISQNLTKVTVSVANSDGTAWSPAGGCSAADFSVNGQPAGVSYDDTEHAGNIAAGTSVNNTVTIRMVDAPTRNQDACKTLAPPLYLSAS